jgi:hypothetical protein
VALVDQLSKCTDMQEEASQEQLGKARLALAVKQAEAKKAEGAE